MDLRPIYNDKTTFRFKNSKWLNRKLRAQIRLWDLNKNCLETFTKGLRRTSQHSIYNYYFVNELWSSTVLFNWVLLPKLHCFGAWHKMALYNTTKLIVGKLQKNIIHFFMYLPFCYSIKNVFTTYMHDNSLVSLVLLQFTCL